MPGEGNTIAGGWPGALWPSAFMYWTQYWLNRLSMPKLASTSDGGRVAAVGAPAETVTDELLARVFRCATAVSRTPPAGVPFVLPHGITTLR